MTILAAIQTTTRCEEWESYTPEVEIIALVSSDKKEVFIQKWIDDQTNQKGFKKAEGELCFKPRREKYEYIETRIKLTFSEHELDQF